MHTGVGASSCSSACCAPQQLTLQSLWVPSLPCSESKLNMRGIAGMGLCQQPTPVLVEAL